MKETKTVYFIMVLHPTNGWIRHGQPYRNKDAAKSWLSFVSEACGGRRTEVESCKLTYIDGNLDNESINLLDEKFNMDAPAKEIEL